MHPQHCLQPLITYVSCCITTRYSMTCVHELQSFKLKAQCLGFDRYIDTAGGYKRRSAEALEQGAAVPRICRGDEGPVRGADRG